MNVALSTEHVSEDFGRVDLGPACCCDPPASAGPAKTKICAGGFKPIGPPWLAIVRQAVCGAHRAKIYLAGI